MMEYATGFDMTGFDMQVAWDRASAEYLARRGDDVRAVSYGNLAPSEAELMILGDLHGVKVLDFGCGGGQNAVSCALAGANVTGVDVSAVQLAAAARLAQRNGQAVTWIHGAVPSHEVGALAPYDLILAIQVLPYVEDVAATLAALRALLMPGGRLVLSLDHPLRNCFYDAENDELSPFPVRPYAEDAWLAWDFALGVPMRMHHAPLGSWVGWLVGAGLQVDRIIEAPAPPDVSNELWPADSPLEPLHYIPHTAIIIGRVPS
jgi:SAM-dependent methyltransferase